MYREVTNTTINVSWKIFVGNDGQWKTDNKLTYMYQNQSQNNTKYFTGNEGSGMGFQISIQNVTPVTWPTLMSENFSLWGYVLGLWNTYSVLERKNYGKCVKITWLKHKWWKILCQYRYIKHWAFFIKAAKIHATVVIINPLLKKTTISTGTRWYLSD